MPVPQGLELIPEGLTLDKAIPPGLTEIPIGLTLETPPASWTTFGAPDPDELLDMGNLGGAESGGDRFAIGRGLSAGTAGLFKQVGTALQMLGQENKNTPASLRRERYLQAAGYAPEEISKIKPSAGYDILKKVGDTTAQYWDQVADQYGPTEDIQGSIVKNPGLLKSPKWWGYNVSQMLPSTVAALTAFMAGGPLAGGIVGGGLEGLSTYDAMIEQGETPENARKAMMLMGTGSAALNAIPFATAVNKVPGLKAKVTQYLLASGAEGVTEWLEEPWDAISKGIATGKLDPEEIKRQTIEGLNVLPVAMVQGLLIPGAGAASQKSIKEQTNETISRLQERLNKPHPAEAVATEPSAMTSESPTVLPEVPKGLKLVPGEDVVKTTQLPVNRRLPENQMLRDAVGMIQAVGGQFEGTFQGRGGKVITFTDPMNRIQRIRTADVTPERIQDIMSQREGQLMTESGMRIEVDPKTGKKYYYAETPPRSFGPKSSPSPATTPEIPPPGPSGTERAAPAPLEPPRWQDQSPGEFASKIQLLQDNTDRLLKEGGYTVPKRDRKIRSQKGEEYLYKQGYRPYLWDEKTDTLIAHPAGTWAKKLTIMEQSKGKKVAPLEPWQMTRKEWFEGKDALRGSGAYSTMRGEVAPQARADSIEKFNYGLKPKWDADLKDYQQVDHRDVIKQALSEGKSVPPEAFKEYPDLQHAVKMVEEGKARALKGNELTPEQRSIIEQGGGIPWAFDREKNTVLFHEPKDHSTLELRPDELTPEAVRAKVEGYGKTGVKQATEEATATLKDFIDKTPKAGLSIGDVSRMKVTNDNVKLPKDASLKSGNPEVEDRWQKAKGITRTGIIAKIKGHLEHIAEQRKTFPGLDYKEDAKVINALREFSAVPEYSRHVSAETTAGIVAGLGPKKYDIFTRNVALPDILKDIDSGLLQADRLPFGYKNKADVSRDAVKFKALADANPDIRAALDRREAFHEALTRELVQAELLPESALSDPRYFHHQVLQYMNERKAHPGVSSKDVRTHKKGFQKGRKGSSLDYNTEYIESEFEYVAQALSQLKTKEIVDRIGNATDISKQVKADAKAQGLTDWRKAIPEGYITWQPKPGTTWYKSLSVPERVIEEVLAGTRDLVESDIREVMAQGGKRKEWVIPERVAKVLDNFRDFSKDEGFDRFVRSTMATWKQWTLLNPVRVLKYNLNNMSGDLDIALAYDPRILKYFKEAAGEAWTNKQGGAMSRDMREAIENGVIGSGFSIQEIPDVKDIGFFKVLMGNDSNIISRYWEQTKGLTQARENILRIAAFKYFKEQLAQGKKVYGASRPELVDAETNPTRKAAMLARDLIGDYGNISAAGQWLRQRMIPFWSWMEINAPRYLRIMRNASLEGKTGSTAARTGTVLAGKAALKTGKVILQANILYAAISAWNAVAENMIDLDDDEKKALYADRRQLQLILGRTSDGQVRTLRVQGAISDALDWMALGDWPSVMKDLASGKQTVGGQLKEMAKAPINKIVNASHPILKTVGEDITGKQLYPDIFNPKPIRDKVEHTMRLLSLDMPYRYLTGKPTKGLDKDLLGMITYTSDPGEQSYWLAKKMTFEYLEKAGKERPGGEPTKRSNALYYFKQAKRFGDETARDKYLKEYIELGGSLQGAQTSIERGSPLGALAIKDRWPFMKSLSPSDNRQVELAKKWYERTMKLTDDDRKKIFEFKKAKP